MPERVSAVPAITSAAPLIRSAKSDWRLSGSASMRVKVNATSEAFTGEPSEKYASSRRVKR